MIALILLLSMSQIYSQVDISSFWDCPGLEKLEQETMKAIKSVVDYDTSRHFPEIEQSYDLSIEVYQLYCNSDDQDRRFKNYMEEKRIDSYVNELEITALEAERVSQYKNPQKEIKRIKKYLKLLALRDNEIMPDELEEKFKSLKSEFNNEKLASLETKGKSSQTKHKKSCQAVDNRRPPLSLRVRDQDSIGWCYAFTAADLLSHKLGKEVSAFDIANSYNQEYNKDLNFLFWSFNLPDTKESSKEGGYTVLSLLATLKKGICFEQEVKSDDFHSQDFKELLQDLEKLKTDFDENYTYKSIRNFFESIVKSPDKIEKIQELKATCPGFIDGPWRQLFPNMTDDEAIEILVKSSQNNILDRSIGKNCNRMKLENKLNLQHKTKSQGDSIESMIESIDDQLQNGNIVGINYYSDNLTDPYDPNASIKPNHGSSVVARRWNSKTGSCDYLVRNSWGDQCEKYSNYYDCEGGNIWLPKDKLTKVLHGINYLE